jgi:hypothetical protein
LQGNFNLPGRFFNALAAMDFESLGYGIVALFVVGRALSVSIWKFRRIEKTLEYVGVNPVSVARAKRKSGAEL